MEIKTFEEAVSYVASGIEANTVNSPYFHFSGGMAIRNNLGLWNKDSPLHKHMLQRFGLCHADDTGMLICNAAHAKKNGFAYDPAKDVQRCKDHWLKMGFDPATIGKAEICTPVKKTDTPSLWTWKDIDKKSEAVLTASAPQKKPEVAETKKPDRSDGYVGEPNTFVGDVHWNNPEDWTKYWDDIYWDGIKYCDGTKKPETAPIAKKQVPPPIPPAPTTFTYSCCDGPTITAKKPEATQTTCFGAGCVEAATNSITGLTDGKSFNTTFKFEMADTQLAAMAAIIAGKAASEKTKKAEPVTVTSSSSCCSSSSCMPTDPATFKFELVDQQTKKLPYSDCNGKIINVGDLVEVQGKTSQVIFRFRYKGNEMVVVSAPGNPDGGVMFSPRFCKLLLSEVKLTTNEELAKEAEAWDTVKMTPAGWTNAPEAVQRPHFSKEPLTEAEKQEVLDNGWKFAGDNYIYLPDDYDGCMAYGYDMIRRALYGWPRKERLEREQLTAATTKQEAAMGEFHC